MMNNPMNHDCQLAALYRAEWLALAVFHAGTLVEVRRHRITAPRRSPQNLATLIANLAHDYAAGCLIVEPDSRIATAARALPFRTVPVTLAEAKNALLAATDQSHQAFYDHLVSRHPRLGRLVTIQPGNGKVAATETWRTVVLLAVALGLAAHERRQPALSPSNFHS